MLLPWANMIPCPWKRTLRACCSLSTDEKCGDKKIRMLRSLSAKKATHWKGKLTLVGKGPLTVLLVHHGQGIGVDELWCGQEVGVECIHVCVEPVVILEIAVVVLCKRTRHVLGHVVHVLYSIEYIQLG